MQKTWTWSATGYTFVGKPQEEILEICTGAGLSGIEGASELFPHQTDAELDPLQVGWRALPVIRILLQDDPLLVPGGQAEGTRALE